MGSLQLAISEYAVLCLKSGSGFCHRQLNTKSLSLFAASSAEKCSKGCLWQTICPCFITVSSCSGWEVWKTRMIKKKKKSSGLAQWSKGRACRRTERAHVCACYSGSTSSAHCAVIAPASLRNEFTVAAVINYSSWVNSASLPDEDETVGSIECVSGHIGPQTWMKSSCWVVANWKVVTCLSQDVWILG